MEAHTHKTREAQGLLAGWAATISYRHSGQRM
jgi:hypothetical protein